ncbi:MAG: DUF4345 family protein [Paracoccaceae bacterium]|nr:DUF4345 family protein [Paracoccaceae bacterium]
MIDAINIAIALTSIGLGVIGWLAPRYTMAVLDLEPTTSTMGVSEIRAASGALFVGLGLGAIFLNEPYAYAMIGFAWAGAAIGRITSILADEKPTQRTWGFFGIELLVAAAALGINLPLA